MITSSESFNELGNMLLEFLHISEIDHFYNGLGCLKDD